MNVSISKFEALDQMESWKDAFNRHNMNRAEDYYFNCLQENLQGTRITLFALVDGQIAGCAHLKFNSDYPYFQQNGIPEINDLNVFSEYQRQGIANQLLDEFEKQASRTHTYIGIGVGLYKDYGAAQRIYCRRGYIPDGNGITYGEQIVEPGSMVRVDDDLNLYFTKELS